MKQMEFENLKEILEFSAPDLLKTQGDTYLCLQELVGFIGQAQWC